MLLALTMSSMLCPDFLPTIAVFIVAPSINPKQPAPVLWQRPLAQSALATELEKTISAVTPVSVQVGTPISFGPAPAMSPPAMSEVATAMSPAAVAMSPL